MRILTPAESRQLEIVKQSIVKLYHHTDDVTITIDIQNRELWLNILDIVLQSNDVMKQAWRSNPSSILTNEVLNKLRPNG